MMRASLQQLCERFVENRQALLRECKPESTDLHPICANAFCARGLRADAAALAAGH